MQEQGERDLQKMLQNVTRRFFVEQEANERTSSHLSKNREGGPREIKDLDINVSESTPAILSSASPASCLQLPSIF